MAAEKQKSKAKIWLLWLLSFVPFLNSIPFFVMGTDSKIKAPKKKKKWKLLGWVVIILNVISIVGLFLSPQLINPIEVDDGNQPESPRISDYLGSGYYEIENYEELPEYQEYLEAEKEYQKALREWQNLPEIKALQAEHDAWNNRQEAIFTLCMVMFFIFNFLVVFLSFAEIRSYSALLTSEGNRRLIESELSTGHERQKQKEVPVQPKTETENLPKPEMREQVNINTATPEQLALLPGITVIDAQKAVRYREERGAFKSIDEFFDLLGLRPHIIVNLQNSIFAGTPSSAEPVAPDSKRKLDL